MTPSTLQPASPTTARFRQRLQSTIAVLAVTLIVCALCYWFVDRPVAYFVHEHPLARGELKLLTLPPPIFQIWTPAVIAGLCLRRAFGPFKPWQRALLAASVGMIIADQFRESLRDVFGRYWPETWINDNPSLIRNGAYGFHFLQAGEAFGSFPSGHAARTVAVAAVVWTAYPRWQWACIFVCVVEAIALIGMNYHFVSDVLAGGVIGGIVGLYCGAFFLPTDEKAEEDCQPEDV